MLGSTLKWILPILYVEMDITNPIKQGIWIGQPNTDIFYIITNKNLLPHHCCCGQLGHKTNICPYDSKTMIISSFGSPPLDGDSSIKKES